MSGKTGSATGVARSVHLQSYQVNNGDCMRLANPKSFLSLLGVVLFSAFAVGCETVEGVGEDVEDLGDEIEDAADDARR
jgi:predicted small secreted protein